MPRLRAALRLLPLLLGLAALDSPPGRADAGRTDRGLERETFALINRYRVSEQLDPFAWSDSAAETARAHSRDMAQGAVDFGHAGFGDRVKRLRSELIGFTGCGENVLMTSDPNGAAQSAVSMWLKSPPHLHNIRGNFGLSGIGVWISAGGVIYFTEIFVRIAPPPPPATPE